MEAPLLNILIIHKCERHKYLWHPGSCVWKTQTGECSRFVVVRATLLVPNLFPSQLGFYMS